jgi:transcriptional regulator with XRE-family HTH domain
MEHENLKRRSQKLNLRGGDLAALANISAPKLSNFFRGRDTLDAAKRSEIVQVLNDLEKMNSYFPVVVSTSDAKQLAVALERFRNGKFESFSKLTKTIDWTNPEGLGRKYPKLFGTKIKKAKNADSIITGS